MSHSKKDPVTEQVSRLQVTIYRCSPSGPHLCQAHAVLPLSSPALISSPSGSQLRPHSLLYDCIRFCIGLIFGIFLDLQKTEDGRAPTKPIIDVLHKNCRHELCHSGWINSDVSLQTEADQLPWGLLLFREFFYCFVAVCSLDRVSLSSLSWRQIPWSCSYRWLWAALYGFLKSNSDPLQGQYVLLTAEPSLQLLKIHYTFIYVSECPTCAGAHGSQKGELELQVAVSHPVVLAIKLWSSVRAVRALNCWAISLYKPKYIWVKPEFIMMSLTLIHPHM